MGRVTKEKTGISRVPPGGGARNAKNNVGRYLHGAQWGRCRAALSLPVFPSDSSSLPV